MKTLTLALFMLTGCSGLLGAPQRQQACYQHPSGERRCFADERALSADFQRSLLAAERATEERARLRALAAVAEQDAKEAAARARATVERTDRIQEDAFGILVELQENAQQRAAQRSSVEADAPSQ